MGKMFKRKVKHDAHQCYRNENILKRSKFAYILFVLKWFGIDILESGGQNTSCTNLFLNIVIALALHVCVVERVFFFYCLFSKIKNWQITLSYAVNMILTLILWYTIYFKKEQLKKILNSVAKLHEGKLFRIYVSRTKKLCFPNFVRITITLACIIPAAYGPAEYILLQQFPRVILYTGFADWNSKIHTVIQITRAFFQSVWRDVFSVCVCMLYTMVCWHISQVLSCYANVWLDGLNETKPNLISVKLISQYTIILNLIEDVDACFSQTMFLLGVVNGLSLFTLMAFVLQSTFISRFVMMQTCLILSTACMSLFITIVMGAQVSLNVQRNLNHLHKVYEAILLTPSKDKLDNCRAELLELIKKRPVRVLSGCHILYYKRSLLLATAGTLITYGLLLINFN